MDLHEQEIGKIRRSEGNVRQGTIYWACTPSTSKRMYVDGYRGAYIGGD